MLIPFSFLHVKTFYFQTRVVLFLLLLSESNPHPKWDRSRERNHIRLDLRRKSLPLIILYDNICGFFMDPFLLRRWSPIILQVLWEYFSQNVLYFTFYSTPQFIHWNSNLQCNDMKRLAFRKAIWSQWCSSLVPL